MTRVTEKFTSETSLIVQYPNVGKNTAVTKWREETMDYDMAVSEMWA